MPCRVTSVWGQLECILLVPEHLLPPYGFMEMRRNPCWHGAVMARRIMCTVVWGG